MAYLPHCYKAKVRLFRDSDLEYEIVWYWADEKAARFPHYHQFHTGNLMDSRVEQWSWVGEVKGTKKFWRGENIWGYKGEKGCMIGTLRQFAEGASLLDPPNPIPACCTPRPKVTAEGGFEIGGRAAAVQIMTVVLTGGMEAGGWSPLTTGYVYAAAGGSEAGGSSTSFGDHAYTPAGGAEAGGTTDADAVTFYTPAGGAEAGGTTVADAVTFYTPAGGAEAGGTAPVSTRVVYAAAGGMEAGGVTDSDTVPYYTGKGGLEAGGSTVITPTTSYSAAGGLEAGGSATADEIIHYDPSGGFEAGGFADAVFNPTLPEDHVRSARIGNAGAGSFSCQVPPGTHNTDVMVAYAVTTSPGTTITPPAGWDTHSAGTWNGGTQAYWIGYRTASSEPASYTWTTGPGVTGRAAIASVRDAYTPPTYTVNAGSGTTITALGRSPLLGESAAIAFMYHNTALGMATHPPGWTKLQPDDDVGSFFVYSREPVEAPSPNAVAESLGLPGPWHAVQQQAPYDP